MNGVQPSAPDRRTLWFGAPGGDDSKRSQDEVRLIKEMTNEEVEIFLQMNSIDTAAAKELRSEPPHIALAVLERGPLRACVNPSGALVARIRDAKRGLLGGSQRYGTVAQPLATLDPNASETDKFLAENRIDQAGAASFRCETREVQKAVMAKGPLVNTTNPSASLMARIRTVRDTVKLNAQASNGVAVGMGVPAAGLPALANQAHAAAPLALEDNRPSAAAAENSLNLMDEAMKAISKLNAQTAPVQRMEGGHQLALVPPSGQNGASGMIQNTEDKRLQDEALKAIQALNATNMPEY